MADKTLELVRGNTDELCVYLLNDISKKLSVLIEQTASKSKKKEKTKKRG